MDIIEHHRTQLDQLCRQYGVQTLEMFGSAADGSFDPARSDLDFLVEFLPGRSRAIFGGYFDLKDALETMFARKVDLVMPGAIRNRCLLRAINQQREPIYAA